jgi:hypothetical protein
MSFRASLQTLEQRRAAREQDIVDASERDPFFVAQLEALACDHESGGLEEGQYEALVDEALRASRGRTRAAALVAEQEERRERREAHDREFARMVEARQEADEREAAAVADYRAWLANQSGEEGRPRFDDGPDFENLRQLAECHFAELTRKRPEELTQARRFVAWRDGTLVDWEQEKYKPSAEHWFIAQDRHWVVPFAQTAAARDEYARRWRDTHHNFRGQEIAVFLPPGEPLQFAMWSVEPLGRDAVQSYLDALSGHAEEPRYTPVAYPLELCEARVYLPAAFEASTSFRERGAATGGSALVLLDTGIAALNKQFRVSGLPLGARCDRRSHRAGQDDARGAPCGGSLR